MRTSPARRRWGRTRLALAVALVAAGTVATVVRTQARAGANEWFGSLQTSSPGNIDWMGRLADGHSLARLSVPGTHESISLCGATVRAQECEGISTDFTKTQEKWGFSAETLTVQYLSGIRSIDVRVRVNRDADGLALTVHHGPYYQHANFADVLART